MKKTFTRKCFAYRSLRLPEGDVRLWVAAATELGLSQSEFVRQAIREKSARTFRGRRYAMGEPPRAA
jgi:hypothetical protein